jgi:uncharacterized protein (DUF2147 family)
MQYRGYNILDSHPMISARIRLQVTALLFVLLQANLACAVDHLSAIGVWRNDDATFEIFDNQGKLSGKIIALKEAQTPEGKQKLDIHNPDPSKRERPIVGLVFMSGFSRKSDVRWEDGTIYDPKTGNTYTGSMELEGTETIKVRGFVGISLMGRTDVWTRVRSSEPSQK